MAKMRRCHLSLQISIHALLAESDGGRWLLCSRYRNFYPRSPCGERLDGGRAFDLGGGISIHALLAESDLTV